jgi:hypothetical protein
MTPAKMSLSPTAAPKPASKAAPDDLASTLQAVAITVEGVYADGYREPGDIAADDVGASRLATALNRSHDVRPGLEKAL